MLSIFIIATLFSSVVFAQSINSSGNVNPPRTKRCATAEYYKKLERMDPLFRAKAEAEANRLLQVAANRPANTNSVSIVPIVFHVIGTAADQAFCSDAVLQRQVDVLNRDFGGLNPDSVKLPPVFKALFGHSIIRNALLY